MSELAKELLPQLDILTAALALFVIVASLGRLYSGLRQFWQGYADGVGKAWIERQHKWLASEDGTFGLARWWLSATKNVCHWLDMIYWFNPPTVTQLQQHSGFWDRLFLLWRHYLQGSALTRTLFIAYVYFYFFCLLLAYNTLPEAKRWQLLALMLANYVSLFLAPMLLRWPMEIKRFYGISIVIFFLIFVISITAVAFNNYNFNLDIMIFMSGSLALIFTVFFAFTVIFTAAFKVVFTIGIAFAVAFAVAAIFSLVFVTVFTFDLISARDIRILTLYIIPAVVLLFCFATIKHKIWLNRFWLGASLSLFSLVGLFNIYNWALNSLFSDLVVYNPFMLIIVSALDIGSSIFFYVIAMALMLLIFPWVNAALDWLSVSASRATFALLQHDLERPSGYRSALRHLGIDVVLALLFKLTLLLLLYFYALLFGDFGVSFDVATISGYWELLNPLNNVDFSWAAIWSSVDYRFITLMLATTLLPTALHFGWVVVYVTSLSLWWLGRRVLVFTVSDPAVFAAMVSLLITGSALTLLYLVVRSSGAT